MRAWYKSLDNSGFGLHSDAGRDSRRGSTAAANRGFAVPLAGIGLNHIGAAYLKNLQTLNLQGRVISGIEALHLQSSQKEAGECLFKILEKMFPRAQLYLSIYGNH